MRILLMVSWIIQVKLLILLKEAVEYLKEFVEKNMSNKDIDIRKYSDAIWNGEEIISHVVMH